MEILLAFAPFATFAVASRFLHTTPALLMGAFVSLVLILYWVVIKKQSPRTLELGTLVLFVGLAAYSKFAGAHWPVLGFRLGVDAGLLLIVLVSMAIRQPFTLQYAKEQVPKELWSNPKFVKTNFVLTGVWAGAFAVIVASDALMLFVPGLPVAVGIGATALALVGAAKFTASVSDRPNSPKSE